MHVLCNLRHESTWQSYHMLSTAGRISNGRVVNARQDDSKCYSHKHRYVCQAGVEKQGVPATEGGTLYIWWQMLSRSAWSGSQ